MVDPCNACSGLSSSHRDRTKCSTCEDCFVDVQVVKFEYNTDPCACHAVGHDKSKLKKMEPMEESLYNKIKDNIVVERKRDKFTLYRIKKLQELMVDCSKEEEEVYLQQIKKLQRDKDISEDG